MDINSYIDMLTCNQQLLADRLIKTTPYTMEYSEILHRIVLNRVTIRELSIIRDSIINKDSTHAIKQG